MAQDFIGIRFMGNTNRKNVIWKIRTKRGEGERREGRGRWTVEIGRKRRVIVENIRKGGGSITKK